MRSAYLFALILSVMLRVSIRGDDPPLQLTAEEQELVNLTNAARKKEGLPELKPHPKLFQSARLHATNMARQDKLDHELDGKTMIDRLKGVEYGVQSAAENIAHKQTTPRKVMASWMESEGHKQNILTGEFIHIGVAMAKNAKGDRYWVQVLATPLVK
ncbi:MAG TPA: CAP domain-containing protein [Gemmatales bacterium]|nr:CAP domain-containing protein [Gemmatales bacterium]